MEWLKELFRLFYSKTMELLKLEKVTPSLHSRVQNGPNIAGPRACRLLGGGLLSPLRLPGQQLLVKSGLIVAGWLGCGKIVDELLPSLDIVSANQSGPLLRGVVFDVALRTPQRDLVAGVVLKEVGR